MKVRIIKTMEISDAIVKCADMVHKTKEEAEQSIIDAVKEFIGVPDDPDIQIEIVREDT